MGTIMGIFPFFLVWFQQVISVVKEVIYVFISITHTLSLFSTSDLQAPGALNMKTF